MLAKTDPARAPAHALRYGSLSRSYNPGCSVVPPIRYMGTKRALAPKVRELLANLAPGARVADLFSGLGAVAVSLSPDLPVLANDALEFASCVARARLLEQKCEEPIDRLLANVARKFLSQRQRLLEDYSEILRFEAHAVAENDTGCLRSLMRDGSHVGNSESMGTSARKAEASHGADHFRLATMYFASSYFSALQAIEVDAVRFAIEAVGTARDLLLACWLAASSRVINSPGHTAQYLQASNPANRHRVLRQWRRPFWATFHQIATEWRQVGTRPWRARNVVTNDDALNLIEDDAAFHGVGAVYADPPYTKDQYSRFYHVFETLYRYDFPASTGIGRCRDGRHSSAFCMASKTREAFSTLFEAVARRRVPFVLSYPAAGLLHQTGADLLAMLKASFRQVEILSFSHLHSTMGASRGAPSKPAMENLYVCRPA